MKTFAILFVFVFFSLTLSASENVKEKAIENAAEETAIRMEQISFERQRMLSEHLLNGEKLLLDGNLEEAEKEFKAVLKIEPGARKAASYIKYIRNLKEKLKKAEESKRVRDMERKLLRKKKQREESLAKIRLKKNAERRENRIAKRKRTVTKEQMADELIRKGKECYEKKEYEKAIRNWEKVIGILDPADPNYRRMLEWMHAAKVSEEREIQKYAYSRKKELDEQLSLNVTKEWSLMKRVQERKEKKKEERREKISAAKLELEKKARQLISLDFENAHLRKVLRYLSKVSKINIVLDENVFPVDEGMEKFQPAAPAVPEPETSEEEEGEAGVEEEGEEKKPVATGTSPRVTIRLKDIPLIEALDVILRTKGLNYRIEENIIYITTEENLAAGRLISKSYRPSGGIGNIVDTLKETVPFEKVEGADTGNSRAPAGSSMVVDKVQGLIFITNTEMSQRMVEDIIRRLSEAPPQVCIETRFIDVAVDNLAQFGIQWNFPSPFIGSGGNSYIGGDTFDSSHKPTTGPGFDAGVTGVETSGIFATYSKLTPTQFEAVLQAFEQSDKVNLLSAPKITVLNNYDATIDITMDFKFIETYDIEEETLVLADDEFKISTAVPGDIGSRKIGVTLKVTPEIYADRKRINLMLMPEVTEHIGWTKYDYGAIGGESESYRFPVKQPIFTVRYVTTSVEIYDGETLVMGGLIEGSETKSELSIPFLGRIPVIGNLFRKKSVETGKRELLIFVTASILEPTGRPLVEK